ncbi:MAG: POT family MFS transporter [Methylococcaceae bacterium]|nr:POT family MFS transporter [Methylococcaceae bacterium]
MTNYRTAPLASPEMPAGIPNIIANEAAERFSFYGMRAILVVFMTRYLMDSSGQPDPMSEGEAKGYFHLFVSAVYITPLLGAILADGFLGKYRTIITLSLVYCLGHLALAVDDTRAGLLIGLGLIAVGAGGIKPCVSAHVGDQFGRTNRHLMTSVFGAFYFAINLGAFAAMLITPWLLNRFGAHVAFAAPGILMLIATWVFRAGRYKFVHIPPGGVEFVREAMSRSGLASIGCLSVIYLFVAMFWALFDQNGSSWVLQAQKMDREIFGFEVLPSQIQASNSLLIMFLIPLFNVYLYPALGRLIHLTALGKIAIGMFVTCAAFGLATWIQTRIDSGYSPGIVWQILAYVVLTAAEVMVSVTCLEFSYTQAPRKMKSFIMAFFMMSIALGNLFTSAVNFFIQNEDGSSKLAGASYFWFFTISMFITAALFLFVVRSYREVSFVQDEQTGLGV